MEDMEIKRLLEKIHKKSKLIKGANKIENLEDLKILFEQKIINEYPAMDSRGERRWYRHPDLDNFSRQTYEKGDKYFYASPVDKNKPNSSLKLCEPKYEYVLKRPLTEEEMENIFSKSKRKSKAKPKETELKSKKKEEDTERE